uniref:Uncharacterized protein n=1 Tax=Ananas comosus var. bracteatus TaxID=296719 RepID=A0A6V7P0U5_ANACO|nr:unnamed protein product [Ananas comosus var. bracteatus]
MSGDMSKTVALERSCEQTEGTVSKFRIRALFDSGNHKEDLHLTSDFLRKREAWAGTFEHIFTELSSPRTDCPEVLPEVTSLRPGIAHEDGWLSEFQSELVELAAVLNGDYFLNSFGHETGKKMTVKQADAYVKCTVKRFIQASKQAIRLGANASAIINMRSALTTVTAPP